MSAPLPHLSRFAGPASWEWHGTTAHAQSGQLVAVLPLVSYGPVAAGLTLDAEERILSAVLAAANTAAAATAVRLLPPLRFGWTPHEASLSRLSFEDAERLVTELAESLNRSGYRKVALLVASPWQWEWAYDLSRDLRVKLGLETFAIPLRALGLDLHPASAAWPGTLALAQALGCGQAHDSPVREGEVRLRPGDALRAEEAAFVTTSAATLPKAVEALIAILAELAGAAPWEPNFAAEVRTIPHLAPRLFLGSLAAPTLVELQDAWVIIPTGAIEQHGPHLPVGVDSLLGAAFLDAALTGSRHVVTGLPITYGKSTEHEKWPGTLSVSSLSLRAMILAQVQGLGKLGFRRFAFLNTHGGNSPTLVSLARELTASGVCEAGMLHPLFKGNLSTSEEQRWGFHAGEWETSLMLAVAPQLVEMGKAVREFPTGIDDARLVKPEGPGAVRSWATEDISKTGVMGDATVASPEKGHAWFQQAIEVLRARLAELP